MATADSCPAKAGVTVTRVTGVGIVKLRGKPRDDGGPKTCEIVHCRGLSYASVTNAPRCAAAGRRA
ncbi:MAG TPA: hypothetical protein VMK12_23115, partial [Anaeromyxobacteraceae bacterium]|nr:hypothetical protein [Anaeromyxobacteraceae bacterium]